jgi:hypothetical protein
VSDAVDATRWGPRTFPGSFVSPKAHSMRFGTLPKTLARRKVPIWPRLVALPVGTWGSRRTDTTSGVHGSGGPANYCSRLWGRSDWADWACPGPELGPQALSVLCGA